MHTEFVIHRVLGIDSPGLMMAYCTSKQLMDPNHNKGFVFVAVISIRCSNMPLVLENVEGKAKIHVITDVIRITMKNKSRGVYIVIWRSYAQLIAFVFDVKEIFSN